MSKKFDKAAMTKAQRVTEAKAAAAQAEFNATMIEAVRKGAQAKGEGDSAASVILAAVKKLRADITDGERYRRALVETMGNADKTPGKNDAGTVGDALKADKTLSEQYVRDIMSYGRKFGRALFNPTFSTVNAKGKEMTLRALASSVDANGKPKVKATVEPTAETPTAKLDTSPKALDAAAKLWIDSGAFSELLEAAAKRLAKVAAEASKQLKVAAQSYAAATE